jgi:hypothetical protein
VVFLGLLTLWSVAALLLEIVTGKARAAGLGGSKAKVRNAAWRDFRRNPDGTGPF